MVEKAPQGQDTTL